MRSQEEPNRLSRFLNDLIPKERGDAGEPSWRLRPFWRWLDRRLSKAQPKATANSMLPVLIKVFAGFSKVDGQIDEHDIDSSLGFLRYDYPKAVYSELRELYSQALKQSQNLEEIAAELADVLSRDQKVLLGVQLYVLISRGVQLHREQLVDFYLFMTTLGVASEAIDLVYQLSRNTAEDTESPDIGEPLEVLHIAGSKPADLVLDAIPDGYGLLAFRFQNQILLKNVGRAPAIVRGRQLFAGEFSRLYDGQRVLLAGAVLDYQDLSFYFNTKKDLSTAELFLTFDADQQPFLDRSQTRGSHLAVKFGLDIRVDVLRNTRARINGSRLDRGVSLEVSLNDKIVFDNRTEISFRELHRHAREMGGQFELLPTRTEYLISNNPNLLRPGDLLLSPGTQGEVLFRIRCDYENKRGELEVLAAPKPVLVEGFPVRDRALLEEGATITVEEGLFLRCHFSDRLIEEERNLVSRLEVRDVAHSFDGKDTALDGVTLTARRGEMICVMGPSGCGKSTLLRCLAGHLKPTQGHVRLNGFDLFNHHTNLTPYLCYIPQEDAFDSLLTVQENIDFATAMRAPHLPASERRRRVDAKLIELGLNERRHRLAGDADRKTLSGGERKRLNVGMDMIGIADVYLIDEPTSGLSSKDSEHVLEIIHGLSRNKIVFASIHQPSSRLFHMFDKALLLDQGGKLAFYGTPDEMLKYFEDAHEEYMAPRVPLDENNTPFSSPARSRGAAATPDFIFDVLETPLRDFSGADIYEEDTRGHLTPARRFQPNVWRDRFQAYRTLQEVREISSDDTRTHIHPPTLPPRINRTFRESAVQLWTCFQRSFLSRLRSRANLVTTILEAPLLALLIAVVLRYSENDQYTFGSAYHIPTYLFLTLVVGMFLGLTNSADEIIRDRSLLTRERNQDSKIFHYLAGKIVTLGIFTLLQCVVYILIGNFILEIRGMFYHYVGWMFLTTLCGVIVGLVVSSLVSDVKTALNWIPVILVPQIILGGALIKYEEMNRNLSFLSAFKRWTNEEMEVENPLEVPLICEFMPLRWSYEALVIAQGKQNPLARLLERIDRETRSLSLQETLSRPELERLEHLKEARTIVLQLEERSARDVAYELERLERRLDTGRFASRRYDEVVPEPNVDVKDVYRNDKIHDLLDRSAIEVLDYRRDPDKPLNVFFGVEKTYKLPVFNRDGLRFVNKSFPTTRVNFYVMWVFIGGSALALWAILRRQLTSTR